MELGQAMAEIVNRLSEARRKRGLSAAALAAASGVSRQTVYAMEAGTFVPNTAVALRLARVLETAVEELFALEQEAGRASMDAVVLKGSGEAPEGQPVQLCRVENKLVASAPEALPWCFPSADAVIGRVARNKARVLAFDEQSRFDSRLLVAGCDPGIGVLARHGALAGAELVLAHRNSSQALQLLKAGMVHIAGTHLRGEAEEDFNLSQVERLFRKGSACVISFAVWEEGLIMAAGNPKGIRGVADLARKNIAFVNREPGSGSRALLDAHLKREGVPSERVSGYGRLAQGHLASAYQVHAGTADCCVSTGGVARALGLHFLPLVTERYDLVIRKQHLELPRMQALLDALNRSGLRRELEGLGGYDTRVTGQRVL